MNPLNAAKNVTNFYPCPKCDKGLVKLRHHLCPCDQGKLNVASIMKVRRGALRRVKEGGGCRSHSSPARLSQIAYTRAPADAPAAAATGEGPASKG